MKKLFLIKTRLLLRNYFYRCEINLYIRKITKKTTVWPYKFFLYLLKQISIDDKIKLCGLFIELQLF